MPGEWYNILSSGALKSAIGAVKGAGMQAVCDIVINHRTATYKSPCDSNWNNFTQPNWGTWAVVKNDYMCNSGSTFCQGSCSCGNADTGQVRLLPSLFLSSLLCLLYFTFLFLSSFIKIIIIQDHHSRSSSSFIKITTIKDNKSKSKTNGERVEFLWSAGRGPHKQSGAEGRGELVGVAEE